MEQAFTYAVGDVHGEITLLRRMLALLPLRDEDTLIFLGDCLNCGVKALYSRVIIEIVS